jgi:hypothetical protein
LADSASSSQSRSNRWDFSTEIATGGDPVSRKRQAKHILGVAEVLC